MAAALPSELVLSHKGTSGPPGRTEGDPPRSHCHLTSLHDLLIGPLKLL